MSEERNLKPATLAAQALGWIDRETGAVIPPIHPSTTFERAPDNSYPSGRVYSRADNPTYDQAESLLASLEEGAGALLFASGMAAASAVFQALRPGDHVVAPAVGYYGIREWLRDFGKAWGLDVDFVVPGNLAALEAAMRPGETRLVWIETPANPTWEITDIAAAAGIAHGAGARLAVDSTVATPILTRPLALGADIVMHSATKYLGGHGDVVAGAVVAAQDDDFFQRIGSVRYFSGAVLGPFEAWLLLRGMRTLHLRVAAASRGAERIAHFLAGHRKVTRVLYPGLADHPGHDIAARQMVGGFGGMLSARIAGGEAAAIAVAARLEIFKRATSLGGVESLVEHRASIEGVGSSTSSDLLRFSIGIEDPEDLIDDLDRALDAP